MENFEYLAGELRKLGLEKREADAYLTLLELNGATASQLAEKLGLSRPTAYRILKTLQGRELVNSAKRKKRTVFLASSPDKFLRVLKVQRRRAEEQEREFVRIISFLQSKYQIFAGKNEIRLYTGLKERKLLLDDISYTQAKEIKVVFSSAKSPLSKELEGVYKKIRKRKGAIQVEEIYPERVGPSPLKFVKRRASKQAAKIPSRALLISDKVVILGKRRSMVLEKEKVVQWFRFLLGECL